MTHPIPAAALRESVAIVGRTGSGKSYAARGAVELLLAEKARVCIIDPTGVWHGLRSSADGSQAGFPVAVFGGDHADVQIADTSGPAVAELLASRNLPAIIDLSEFSRSAMIRFAGPFLDTLYRENPRTPLTLVVDEADIFAPQRPEPDSTTLLGRMEQIVRRGRVRGFRPWLITQRPASLNKNVLSQANTLIAMQLTAPQDRDAIGAWIEGQADRDEGKKVLAALPKLQKGEGFVWSPSHDVLERVRFPKITTFDSGRTPEEGEALPQLTLAAVDLAEIAESLKDVEEAKAKDDPKALRARIAELEREARKPRESAVDFDALQREYTRGRADGYAYGVRTIIATVGKSLQDAIDVLHAYEDTRLPQIDAAKTVERRPAVNPPPPVKHPRQFDKLPRSNNPASSTNGALAKAERLVLTALAQYPQGRTKNQVAILTGYAVNGGGFGNAISSLRTKAYLEGDATKLVITQSGIAALGHFDPLPEGFELREYWFRQLGKAERKALETLSEVYPRSLSKAQLANRAGYEANGGGFNNALSRLRTLELISGKAELRASADLFDR